MHSLTKHTYADIRAAVLSFISNNEVGTYAADDHVLVFENTDTGYQAAYKIGPHNWKFDFSKSEVKFSQGLTNTPWKYQ